MKIILLLLALMLCLAGYIASGLEGLIGVGLCVLIIGFVAGMVKLFRNKRDPEEKPMPTPRQDPDASHEASPPVA